MIALIDKKRTGERIRRIMLLRGVSVQLVRTELSLGCVQSVYHWLDGKSLPTLDNLYALSGLLCVPMDLLVCGSRGYPPSDELFWMEESRLVCYKLLLGETKAA